MRNPSGYGSVIKLSGKRRKPFAVRTSTIQRYINVYIGQDPAYSVRKALDRLKFTFNKKKGYWSALSTPQAAEWADALSENGIDVRIEYRQTYIFHEYFAKRDDALRYLASLNSGEVVKEQEKDVVSPTFAEVYEEMMNHLLSLKKQLTQGTLDSYKYGFNNLAKIHNTKMSDLKAADIQVILNKNNTKTKSHIGIIRKVLQKVENYSFMQRYITDGYMKYLVFEYTDSDRQIHKAFSDSEIALLWGKRDIPYVDFVLLTIYTGMRPSEVLNLKTENIHLDERYMIGGMKTDAGRNRTIPISERIYPVLKDIYNPDKPTLYPDCKSYRALQIKYHDLMEKLGLDHKPHDGRHTFATLMDRYGANQVCTKMIMGHSLKDNITEGIYTHKELSDLLEAVNLILV